MCFLSWGTILLLTPSALLLHNCEHLIDACARLVDHLLRACPNLWVLTTSREPLGISGELVWRVPGLGLPHGSTVAATADAEALVLFREWAAVLWPGPLGPGHT